MKELIAEVLIEVMTSSQNLIMGLLLLLQLNLDPEHLP